MQKQQDAERQVHLRPSELPLSVCAGEGTGAPLAVDLAAVRASLTSRDEAKIQLDYGRESAGIAEPHACLKILVSGVRIRIAKGDEPTFVDAVPCDVVTDADLEQPDEVAIQLSSVIEVLRVFLMKAVRRDLGEVPAR